MKKLLIAFVLFLGVAFSAFAEPLTLAENGKTAYKIVLPDQPKGFDRMAADDLKNYLGKMTGADFQIVPESQASGQDLIYVGQTGFARKQGIDFAALGAEEWVIRPLGKNLILSGGYPIGSFYAVWNLLNRLGCFSLTWDQEAIPERKTLTENIPAERKKPVFDGRWVSDTLAPGFWKSKADPSVEEAYRLWKLRNWMNGRISKSGRDGLWTYGPFHYSVSPPAHTLCLYVPRKLFKTHPEYFSMDQFGKRFCPRTNFTEGSVCMSNPAVAEVALDSLRGMIRKERAEQPREKWATVYDITTLDISPYICKCPECTAIAREEGSETGLLLRFINKIATEIRKEYPEIIIRTFGYGPSQTPPTKTMPADNVLIFNTDKFSESDPYRPLTDPLNADRVEYFRKWAKCTKRQMVWDYWNLSTRMPDTVFDAIQPDLRFFRDLGVCGMYLQSGSDYFKHFMRQSFHPLSHFVAAQLLLDPEKDPEKLADIFLKYYYGPAAPRMKKLFNDIRAGMKIQKNRQSSAVVAHWTYLTPEFMYETYSDLKKLSASLPENSVWRRRVDAERINFTWYALAKRYVYGKVFRDHGIDINDLLPECRQLAKAYIRRYPCSRPEVMDEQFEKTFRPISLNLPRPAKFKDVPEENFRMIAWPHFLPKKKSSSGIVDDPDSIQGKAVRSNRPEAEYHGIGWFPRTDKSLPKLQITQFRWGNHKAPGRVSLTIKEIPQDEKYHWYRMPGKLELKPVSYFYGHGWAFQAETSHLYTLTDGNPLDNTWDEVWFSAKFTGPAYVKGSTKENAIFVDMAVLIRKRD